MKTKKTKLSIFLMRFCGIAVFVITAIVGIIYDSNLWPPAALIYGVLSAGVGFAIGFIIETLSGKSK